MSLPSLASLTELMDLYKSDRRYKHDTFIEKTLNFTETTLGFFTGRHSSQIQREKICSIVMQRLSKSVSIEDWLEIVYFLGEKAAEAQQLKKLNCCQEKAYECCHKQSLLCETLHAMRNHIVTSIIATDDNNRNVYDTTVTKLQDTVTELKAQLKVSSGKHWKMFNADLNKQLLKLSFLEVREGINGACQARLFNYLKLLSHRDVKEWGDMGYRKLNEAHPRCLQEEFFPILLSRLKEKNNIVLVSPSVR
jgi:hypothetical protein